MGDTTMDLFGHGADPFGGSNALAGAGSPSRRSKAQYPPLPQEEAAPLKEQLLGAGVSGLHYVGSSLDKAFGARAIRGLAAGKLREAASAIPFSDTMGLTKPEDAVSMDDLLTKHYKVFKPNDPNKWEFRDFAIPALEIAADPGTWMMPLGAATRAGKLAAGLGHTQGWTRKALTEGFTHTEPALKALGHSPEAIAHMANQGARIAPQSLLDEAAKAGLNLTEHTPLRGALGFGRPFSEAHDAIGTGALGRGLAGLQDRVGGALSRSYPARVLRPLFDDSVMRATDPTLQAAASGHGSPAREAMQAATRAGEFEQRTRLDKLMQGFQANPGVENEALRLIRGAAEGASPVFSDPGHWQADLLRRHAAGLATGVQDPHAVAAHVLNNWGHLQGMGADIQKFGEDIFRNAQDIGVKSDHLNDLFARYAARRYIGSAPGIGGTDAGRQFATMHGSNIHRQNPLRDVPGGTEQLNEWAINPALSGPGRATRPVNNPALVHQQLVDDMTRHELLIKGTALDPADVARIDAKAKEVSGWLKTVPAIHAEQGMPYFNPDIIGDYAMRGQRHAQVAGASAASIEAATQFARPIDEFLMKGEHHVPLGDFLARGGQGNLDTFTRAGANGQAEWHGAGMRAWEKMANKGGLGPVSQAQVRPGGPVPSALPYWQEMLNQHAISADQADQITRFLKGWQTPTEMKPILGPLAGAQQLFKNMVYPIWPASHFRNAVSAVWNNTLHGTNLGDYADAASIMRHGMLKEPARYAQTLGMSPEQAAHFLKKGSYADAKVFSGVNSFEEHVGGRGLADEKLTAGLRGEQRLVPRAPGVQDPLWGTLKKNGWSGANPLGQQGVLGHAEDTFAPLVIGRRLGSGIEDYVRMSNYLGNLRRGMNSARAGQLTRDIHFDYSKMTPFERNVMKPLIPFYTFMKNNLPYQTNMALNRPGSVSPVLHAMNATNPNAPWVPEHLASGAAIPIGQEQRDGTQRYISSFGLPMEEAFQRFKFRNYETPWGQKMNLPSLGATARTFLGDASPYLKAPIEWMTNTQFKTGRPLDEMYSKGLAGGYGAIPEEYAQPLTHLVANSPLARVFSSINTGVDPRKGAGTKWANLFTGVRNTDIDMDQQRSMAMRAEINHLLKTDPRIAEFINYYPRPEEKGNLTPDLVNRLRLFGTLKAESKAFHKQKADAEKLRSVGNLFPGLR